MAPMTAAEMANVRQGINTANWNIVVAVLKVKQTGAQRANLQSTQEKIVGQFQYLLSDTLAGPISFGDERIL